MATYKRRLSGHLRDVWLAEKLLCWVHSQAIQNQGMRTDREERTERHSRTQPTLLTNFVAVMGPKV